MIKQKKFYGKLVQRNKNDKLSVKIDKVKLIAIIIGFIIGFTFLIIFASKFAS